MDTRVWWLNARTLRLSVSTERLELEKRPCQLRCSGPMGWLTCSVAHLSKTSVFFRQIGDRLSRFQPTCSAIRLKPNSTPPKPPSQIPSQNRCFFWSESQCFFFTRQSTYKPSERPCLYLTRQPESIFENLTEACTSEGHRPAEGLCLDLC